MLPPAHATPSPANCVQNPLPLSTDERLEILKTILTKRKSSQFREHTATATAKSLQSGPTLCDPMDYSLPGSSVHGILQARILKWVAVPSSRGSS